MNGRVQYFLGANSDKGFVSYFEQLQEQYASLQLLILKGGPGSGKSTLMKRVCAFAEKKGHVTECVPCASDIQSLDAFIDLTAGFAVMDGTAPHTVDPRLPGAAQHIMNTGDCWSCAGLRKNVDAIACLSKRINAAHSSATAFIKGAGALLRENMRAAQPLVDYKKLYALSAEISADFPYDNGGKEFKRLLDAASVGEVIFFDKTITSLAKKIIVIDDEWGFATDFLIKELLHTAASHGIGVISFPSDICSDFYRHLYIPSVGLFVTSANGDKYFPNAKRISALYSSSEDETALFCRKRTAVSLIHSACEEIARAKALHDELEAHYVRATDFSKTDNLYREILNRFYGA